MTGLELVLSVITLLGFIYIVLQHQLIKNMEDLEKAYERYIQSLKDNKERMTKLTDTRHMLTSKHINILKKDRSTLEWKITTYNSKIEAQRANIKLLMADKAKLELKDKRNMEIIKRERQSVQHMWSVVIANCVQMDKMKQRLRPIEDVDRALQWWKEQYHNKAKQLITLELELTDMEKKYTNRK